MSDEIKELVTRNNGNFIRIGGFDQLMFMLSRELGFDSPENEINEAAKDRIERYNKRYQEFSQEITQQTEKESASDEIAKDTKSAIDTFNAERLRRATERIEKEGTAENFFARGEIYIDAAMYREAIEDYTKAIELDSNYRSVYNNRGFVYTGLKEYEKAIADYKKAIELDKNIANPYGQIVQIVVESARER
ncbi:MAG: tetratricopeptide repeat protein [Clostridiales bacterium]|nr:tetratricopeptide repeat protein [Clostridiales bacterium]